MNPFTMPESLLKDFTMPFHIERNRTIVDCSRGFFCGNDYPDTIQLVEPTDIQNGDWLISDSPKQRYYVADVKPILVNGSPHDYLVKYLTERAFSQSSTSHQNTFNIQSVTGNAIIGSQTHATFNIGGSLKDIESLISSLPPSDREEASKLVSVLKTTEESPHPILVEGALSKFSDLIKKHTDLLTAVGSWAVQLLIGQK